jgi:RimJ/RimL family protein N-acetyltransferase
MNITFSDFNKDDFELLKQEIPDAKFLMQWAGPKYVFPITRDQVDSQINRFENGKRNCYLYSAWIGRKLIGHVQFTIVDFPKRIANIGSVLIFRDFRGKGLGKFLMQKTVEKGFDGLLMDELRLGVFDFNVQAIRCYQNIGFSEFSFEKAAREIEGEKWNLIRMKLTKNQYLACLKH